jgi:hypothetical protein
VATDKSKTKAAESEKDAQKSAVKDESKTVETTKQAEAREENLSGSAEKREVEEDRDVNASEVGTRTGLVVDGENEAFDEDAEVDADDFEDGGNLDGVTGAVVERNLDGDEYEVPYTLLTAADLKPRTSDSDDPAKDWTAQHASGEREDADGNSDPVALVPVEGTPGQTFRVRELPDREVAEAAGIDYDQWVAGLPVRADVPNEAPRRGIPS